MANPDEGRYREMIEEALKTWGYEPQAWRINEEEGDRPEAVLGRFRVIEDVDEVVFEGDEGELVVSVVGSQEYQNLRVHVGFMADGTDCPGEVTFDDVEPVD